MSEWRVGKQPFAKGHGTGNDFVIIPDVEGHLEVTDVEVRAWCDRRTGIGGDGLLRVVPTAAMGPGSVPAEVNTYEALWFMDYRNADGSIAEMCGNGVRVFAAYLWESGLVGAQVSELAIGTRAGTKYVRRVGEQYAVRMGHWQVLGGADAVARGWDTHVQFTGHPTPLPGLRVVTGNPHVITALSSADELTCLNLKDAPQVDPVPVGGSNVECMVPHAGTDGVGHVQLRVYERGVGETQSCGTGVVATAIAARAWAGPGGPQRWLVDVPGGRLHVDFPVDSAPADDVSAGSDVVLTGPAVLVASGTVL